MKYLTALALAWLAADTAGTAPQRPPITGIAHIAVASQNLAASRAFYTGSLGWTATASPEFPDGARFYGDPRQTVEVRSASSPSEPALDHIAFATADAEALRQYLGSKGVAVPSALTTLRDGEKLFRVRDPEGNAIEFVQRPPGFVKAASNRPASLSGRIIHAGLRVKSASAEDRFYRDTLGFRPYWSGGMREGVVDWASLQVPDGTDWIEYMLNQPAHPTRQQIGGADHFSLGVVHMDTVVAELQKRGFPPGGQEAKQMGRDGKYQLNEYDPDEVRVEFMEFHPSQPPCCHPFTGVSPSAGDAE